MKVYGDLKNGDILVCTACSIDEDEGKNHQLQPGDEVMVHWEDAHPTIIPIAEYPNEKAKDAAILVYLYWYQDHEGELIG